MVKDNKEINKKIGAVKDIKKIQVPTKNYVIVAVIFILTMALVLFLRNWYQSYQDYQKTIPILKGIVSEVRYNEIDNFINDNPSAIIYIGVADDEDCRNIESKLKVIITEKHLKDKIIYFNITDIGNRELLLKEFNDKYATDEKIYSYPAIIILDEGKIVSFKSKNAKNNLSIGDIEQLFEEYELYGD